MSAPLLVVNHRSTVPPYEQISLQLCMLISTRQLTSGTTLPPIRQLADDLDVAPNTIIRAYDELENEGWVLRAARKNVVVASNPPPIDRLRRQRLEQAVAALFDVARLLKLGPAEICAEIDRQATKVKE